MPPLEDTLRRLLSMTREAGTPAAAEARSLVADHLRALGYTVTLQPFTFHPSSLKAFPLFGAGLGGIALVLLPLLTFPSVPGWGALVVLVCGLAGLVVLTIGIGLGWIPLGGRPREDANLLAVRGSVPATRWLVAHLDTKAQVQSMAGRLVAVWVVGLGVAGLLALSAVRFGGTVPIELAGGGAAVAVIGGALAGRGRLHGHSPGARDNGTGVAAALAAAEASRDSRTAVLITGAEEFGMVGARMFVKSDRNRLASSVAINFDTIDDQGGLYLVSHDGRGEALAGAATRQLTAAGFAPRTRRLPIGILVDSLPLARAGMPAVTIGRLTWRTLRLIHTTKDTSERLSLTTAMNVGRALATN